MIKRIHDFLPDVKDYYTINDKGEIFSDNIHGQKMKDRITKQGYNRVVLSLVNNCQKSFMVHRLVLMAFNPNNDYENLQVNHIDGNKLNNNIENLEWCTASENQKHAVKMGLNWRVNNQNGEKNHNAKLTQDDVNKIFELRKQGLTHQAISKIFNVSRRHIGNILQGKRWNKQV